MIPLVVQWRKLGEEQTKPGESRKKVVGMNPGLQGYLLERVSICYGVACGSNPK